MCILCILCVLCVLCSAEIDQKMRTCLSPPHNKCYSHVIRILFALANANRMRIPNANRMRMMRMSRSHAMYRLVGGARDHSAVKQHQKCLMEYEDR